MQREINREFNSDIRSRSCEGGYGRELREGVESKVVKNVNLLYFFLDK